MPTSAENGLLARMSVSDIGDALRRLPDAATYHADEIQLWSTTPSLGRVLVTFKRHHYEIDNRTRNYWVAVRAQRMV